MNGEKKPFVIWSPDSQFNQEVDVFYADNSKDAVQQWVKALIEEDEEFCICVVPWEPNVNNKIEIFDIKLSYSRTESIVKRVSKK